MNFMRGWKQSDCTFAQCMSALFRQWLKVQILGRFALAKVPLCLLIGCSTIFGYILADPVFTLHTFYTGFAIFVLAAGAASLNSMQECRLDRQMQRTKNRPLPQGLLSTRQAAIQAMVLLWSGLLILHTATMTPWPVVTAACAVFLYNGIYTPLKQKTTLAIVPGAVCGALPAYVGWLGGGGQAICYSAALLIALFVLWQIPHFWLVLLAFKEDYQNSVLPNPLQQFSEQSLKRFFITWIGALVLIMLMFLTLPFSIGLPFTIPLIINILLLPLTFIYGLVIAKPSNYRFLFILLNCSLFLHMAILTAGRIFS